MVSSAIYLLLHYRHGVLHHGYTCTMVTCAMSCDCVSLCHVTFPCAQVITLLQKFLQSDVIEDARGKDVHQFESGSHLYRFVKMPGPLNFLDEDIICITNSYALAHPGEKRR